MLFAIKNQCLEIKKLYSGQVKKYLCSLIHLDKNFGILQYRLNRDYKVDHLYLPEGTLSLGFFWQNRPYNIYQWYQGDELTATYFNISDHTRLDSNEFSWRDLILDILIVPGMDVKILDEQELKIISDKNLLNYIVESRKNILNNYEEIIMSIDKIVNRLKLA
ncbi:MAG: DUF402 domain-containing protein [Fidelibacterota bacterium]